MTQNPPELTTICGSVAQRSSRLLADFAQKQAASLSSAVRDEIGHRQCVHGSLLADGRGPRAPRQHLDEHVGRLHAAVAIDLDEDAGTAGAAGRRAGEGRRALQGRGLVDELRVRLHQAVLPASPPRHIQQAVAEVEGLPPKTEKKVAFFTRQYVDALAPSNFLMTNPQVLRETRATPAAQNLVRGLNNLLADLEKGGGELRVSHDRREGFPARPQRRHHAGQGGLQTTDAAHPVPARPPSRCTSGRW